MKRRILTGRITSAASCLFATLVLTVQATAQSEPPTRFEITVPAGVHDQPITGRVYVMIARSGEREPRLQIGRQGEPFFGRDVETLRPGTAAVIDHTDLGWPVEYLNELPAGDYYVQGFVNIYSEFRRADGHVLWMHDDQWEGQHFNRSPGNLYSDVQRIHLDPSQGFDQTLIADNVIPPIEIPANTEWVERFRIQSPMLTEFWGRPIYLGATVLLPRDYHSSTFDYPVLYKQGHFSLRNPLGFQVGNELYHTWIKDEFPRMLVVTFQHPTPYFDDSYAVNSVNVGPYGDALLQELIPEIERRYRAIKQPWARLLDGGSTGGWEALALQIFNPDFFGGAWSYCPDPVTFTNVEGVNIYEDANAFYKDRGLFTVPTINSREINGEVRVTSEQRNRFELVSGTKGRSGQQLDIWAAVHGPVGDDGYFEPLYDKRTGVINRDVAEYWRENFDLLHHMQTNWSWLGPKLVDKIRVYTGDMDNYYLNFPVMEMEAWMKTSRDPHYAGFFMYGRGRGHCYSGPVTTAERLVEMAQYLMLQQPPVLDTPWWMY
ncbi:alpha/beta hydrolase-fold protein [Gemmatimonadota bacterium]